MDQNIIRRMKEIDDMSPSEMENFMHQKNNIHHSSDAFTLDILEYKKNGYYVEMGSGDPISGNTTYKMESEYDWTGVGFELDPEKVEKYNSARKNKVLMEDATKFNYLKYFEENNYPKQIDYLQIDIESPIDHRGRSLEPIGQPLNGLISLPLNQYRFTVICFEHDTILHYKNASMRDAQREILNNLGYSLVVKLGHEDWWVDPTVIPYPVYKYYGKHQAP